MTPKEIVHLTSSAAHKKALEEVLPALENQKPLQQTIDTLHKVLTTQAAENKTALDASKPYRPEELDNQVHDCKSNEASDINNAGPEAQKQYLIVECGERL